MWVTAIFTLAGVVIGALLPSWVTSYSAWRTSQRELFDKAIAAVKAAELALRQPNYASPAHFGTSPQAIQAAAEYNSRLPERALDKYNEAAYEMRQALAALEPYFVPEWNSIEWQITPETAASLLQQLKKARPRSPLWG
jgi:hypothetical protein